MKLKKYPATSPQPAQPTGQATLSTSVPLTASEIESLRQGKKRISDYIQKEFADLALLSQANNQELATLEKSPTPV